MRLLPFFCVALTVLAGEPRLLQPTAWLGDLACVDSLAFLGSSGRILVLALPEGQVVGELPFPGPVYALAWDGRRLLAAGGWNVLRVWRWPEGTLLWETETSALLRSLAFASNGLLLGGGANGLVLAWDLQERRQVWSLEAHPGAVWGIAASPRAVLFATAGSDRLAVWDLAARQEVRSFPGRAWDVAFSPDGFLLAAGMGKLLRVWDTAVWLPLWEAWAHESCTVAVAFSPDGTLLATGSLDHTAKAWDVSTGQVLFTSPALPAVLAAVRFSPLGFLLAGAEDGTLVLWRP